MAVSCTVHYETPCVGGRHSGVMAQRASGEGRTEVGAWLAREAAGEAGSVWAFRQLARELGHHGAPAQLVEAAEAAAEDEVRHARMVTALAGRHGGRPKAVAVSAHAVRDLRTVALENAVEGCVHETFAAARAALQARQARDMDVRQVSAVLAADEARHADLAAAVHAWAGTVLPAEVAAEVEQARTQAWAQLLQHRPTLDEDSRVALGLPDRAQRDQLIHSLAAALA